MKKVETATTVKNSRSRISSKKGAIFWIKEIYVWWCTKIPMLGSPVKHMWKQQLTIYNDLR